MKKPVSFKFSEEAIRLLKAIATTKGISQAAVLEVAIRQIAKKECTS